MKTTLLAICGLAPQVITETLYALHQQGKKVDAIRILTTREGKSACISNLIGSGDGHYFQYLEEYGIDRNSIDFSPRHVVAVKDQHGCEIDDISTEEDNEHFLLACMKTTFSLTQDTTRAVCFSLAGGRKTMSACLGLAAQCYARRQDRIFHVLVTPEFERCHDFYYPPITPRKLKTFTRERLPCVVSTEDARISLVPLPFFPLRESLPEDMLQAPESPASLKLSLVREEKGDLVINLIDKKVIWKGVEADISAKQIALYAFFAKHKKEVDCQKESCRDCRDCYLTSTEVVERRNEIKALYDLVRDRTYEKDSFVSFEGKDLRTDKSRAISELIEGFGPYEAAFIEIASTETRPAYMGIPLDRERIKIIY